MTARKKLIFWGPGHIGGAALREVLRTKQDLYEVVGARVYNDGKVGKDIGELVGCDPIGVAATNSTEEILALHADLVVYTPQPLDPDQVVADALALLRSGKSVTTTATFHFPQLLGAEFVEQLKSACSDGNATLHGTGIHPSFMVERLVTTLTGLSLGVSHIRLAEACESSKALHEMAPEFLTAIGFGAPLDSFKPDAIGAQLVAPYYYGTIGYVASEIFGANLADLHIENEHYGIAATEDLVYPNITIQAGTAQTVVHVHKGYIGDHHFFTNEEYYYVGADNKTIGADGPPFGPFSGDANYAIEVTGDPHNIRVQLDVSSTRDDNVPPITYLSVVPLLQSIDPVIKAQPGLLFPSATPHWTPN